jgi:hypothetical protein
MGSSAPLDRSPKRNWIENVKGELPPYVREIARSIEKTGKSLESAIAIAISRIKVWATGKGVSAQVQAKASKAVAQWEALKGKAHGRVAATYSHLDSLADSVSLTPFDDLLLQVELANAESEVSNFLDQMVKLSSES